MRSIFVFMVIIGFTPASAEVQSNPFRAGSMSVGTGLKTPSITRKIGLAEKPTLILKKTDRLPRSTQNTLPTSTSTDGTSSILTFD